MAINDSNEERIVSTGETNADTEIEYTLRPKILSEYIGQTKAKENLKVFIEAAKMRGEPLDHVLLYGPPGLGKTTLAGIIANEMGVNIRITSGPAIEKPGDLAALLTNLSQDDILFVDEIHRMSRSVEEILYPAMEWISENQSVNGNPVSGRYGDMDSVNAAEGSVSIPWRGDDCECGRRIRQMESV